MGRREGGWRRRCVSRGGIEDLVIILFTAFIRASSKSAGVISRGKIRAAKLRICMSIRRKYRFAVMVAIFILDL